MSRHNQGRRDRRPDGGPLHLGGAQANIATLVVDEINAAGGVFGCLSNC